MEAISVILSSSLVSIPNAWDEAIAPPIIIQLHTEKRELLLCLQQLVNYACCSVTRCKL